MLLSQWLGNRIDQRAIRNSAVSTKRFKSLVGRNRKALQRSSQRSCVENLIK
jgi:hypothetical protein